MIKFKLLFASALLAISALAQSALEASDPADQGAKTDWGRPATERAQRRAELRAALRTSQPQWVPAAKPSVKPANDARHLSAKERAELRQQLRAQQHDKADASP